MSLTEIKALCASSRQKTKATMPISARTDQEPDETDAFLKRHNARLLSKEQSEAVAHLFPKRANIFQRFRKFIGLADV
jgi:hypothetical protein